MLLYALHLCSFLASETDLLTFKTWVEHEAQTINKLASCVLKCSIATVFVLRHSLLMDVLPPNVVAKSSCFVVPASA